MTDEEIRAAVLAALAEIAPEVPTDSIDPSESLRDDLDLDSMDFLAFVRALHEATGVEVPEVDYPRVDGVDRAVSYLASKAAG